MCDFCDKHIRIQILTRSQSADDNVCDKLSPDGYGYHDCSNCNGCVDDNNFFELSKYDDFITLGFCLNIKDVLLYRFSERICFKFCPMCGQRIMSDEEYNKTYKYHKIID